MSLRSTVSKALHHVLRCYGGVDFYRVSPYTSASRRLALLAERLSSTLMFDIGANEGQFAAETLASGYRGRIVSIEPGSSAHAVLCRQASSHSHWQAASRSAIGERRGVATLHVAGNSVSSSLRAMKDAHADAAPESRYVNTETVEVITCDDLFEEFARPDDRGIILKVDVQGHESAVLDGAVCNLPRVDAILMELSLTELYEGQRMLEDQLMILDQLGFGVWDLDRGFMDPRSGRLLQVDATFVRHGVL